MKTIIVNLLICFIPVLLCNCSPDTVIQNNEPPPYDIASAVRGGIMFDRFWSIEAGFNQSDTNIALFNSRPDFFKCNHCHGWDNLGRFGSYIGRGPNSERPNVAGLNLYSISLTKSPQDLFNSLKTADNRRNIRFDFSVYIPQDPNDSAHKMPNYGEILTEAQLWDLVKFLKEGTMNVAELYNASYSGIYPTGTAVFFNIGKDGNSANGINYYLTKCSLCHGPQGTEILVEGLTIGNFTRTRPYEVQHKVKYGKTGSNMTGNDDISLSQMKDLYKVLSDSSAFPN